MSTIDDVQKLIDEQVKGNPIIIYLKGTPERPMCGFSARAVDVLKSFDVPFAAVNVLENEGIRQGIKQYANWPTIPQIYIDGKFIGGCDILVEMKDSGELEPMLRQAAEKFEFDKAE